MKNRKTELIVIVFLLFALLAATGCEAIDRSDDTNGDNTTLPVTTDTESEESIPVMVEPSDPYSRGLSYESNGDGTCTLVGIGSCTDTAIIIPEKNENGETVTKISERALAGNIAITSVQIPAGILEIGNGAFSNCPALAYISVDHGNTKYTDMGGILYTADETRLVCVPAGSSYVTITLTKKVKQINEGATDGCIALKRVMYEGSREDWKTVYVAPNNAPFLAAEISFMTPSGK